MAKDTGTISEAAYVKAKQVIAQYKRQQAEKEEEFRLKSIGEEAAKLDELLSQEPPFSYC
jgi:hypothetical protein